MQNRWFSRNLSKNVKLNITIYLKCIKVFPIKFVIVYYSFIFVVIAIFRILFSNVGTLYCIKSIKTKNLASVLNRIQLIS